MKLAIHDDRAAQAEALAKVVARELNEAVAKDGRATLAVPGGATPKQFLSSLALEAVEWPAVTVIATDERWTPPSDPRSNEAMIRAALGGEVRFLPFWRERETPASVAPALSAMVAEMAPLTSVILGMGGDMHCASLFPMAEGLVEALSPASAAHVAAITPPGGELDAGDHVGKRQRRKTTVDGQVAGNNPILLRR